MTTDTTEKGLETLIVEAMTGVKTNFVQPDTGQRTKRTLWWYRLDTGTLARIMTVNMQ